MGTAIIPAHATIVKITFQPAQKAIYLMKSYLLSFTISLLFFSPALVSAKEVVTISDFSVLAAQVSIWEKENKIAADAILIVYDLDRTLITKPAYPRNTDLVRKFQKDGIASMVLSSRTPNMIRGTAIELKKINLDFAIKPLPLKTNASLPEDTIYQNGIFLGNKHNKGELILKALENSDVKIKAVIFVDDDVSNCKKVIHNLETLSDISFASYLFQPKKRGAVKKYTPKPVK